MEKFFDFVNEFLAGERASAGSPAQYTLLALLYGTASLVFVAGFWGALLLAGALAIGGWLLAWFVWQVEIAG